MATRCRWRSCRQSRLHLDGLCQFHYNEAERLRQLGLLAEVAPFVARDMADTKARALGLVETAQTTEECPTCGKSKPAGKRCSSCVVIDRAVDKLLDEDDADLFKV